VELKFSASQHIGAQAAEVSEAKAAPLWLGATWRSIPTGLELTTVLDGGPLQSAGINPGDVIIAMDKLQLDARNVQQRLGRYQAGDRVTISAFRGDELIDRDVLLTEAPNNHCVLSLIEPVGQPARGLRKAWLGV
jgi:predicted metalloprotease with PDZ domain